MEENKQIATQSNQHSAKLIQCLIKLEIEETHLEAKLELTSMTSQLMPSGNPNFREVIRYPMITRLIAAHGRRDICKVLFLLIKDFCDSVNVVRNMTEDQMIECASVLLDECDNFRIEDYVMMFSLGKRGRLARIMDRVDMNVISQMHDVYSQMRATAGERIYQEEFQSDNNKWNDKRVAPPETEKEKEMSERFGQLVGIMEAWKDDAELKTEAETLGKRIKKKLYPNGKQLDAGNPG